MDLTNAQWARIEPRIEPLVPVNPRRADGKGRPSTPPRPTMNAILWILRTGAPWHDLPTRYPPYQTVHRWFQKWTKQGVIHHIWEAPAEDLAERGKIDMTEAAIDGSFASSKKGATVWENQARQGNKDHGNHRPPWHSCRYLHRKCNAARSNAG